MTVFRFPIHHSPSEPLIGVDGQIKRHQDLPVRPDGYVAPGSLHIVDRRGARWIVQLPSPARTNDPIPACVL